jgi:NhaP-type Na+/H+ or K+/H+ antiporter
MFEKLDAYLLARAQNVCDRFTRWTGYTKFRLEIWCSILAAISSIVGCAEIGFNWFITLIAVFLLISYTARIWHADREERAYLSDGRLYSVLWNARERVSMASMSTMVACVMVFSAYGLTIAFVADAALVYVNSCLPRRPGKSKLRKLAEREKERWRDLVRGAPTPAPVPLRIR